MDLASAAGIGLALFSVMLGVIVIGLTPGQIIDIPSAFITVGGAIGGTMLGNPLELTTGAGKTFGLAFKKPEIDLKEKINQIVSFSEKARRDGLLALEDDMSQLSDEFLRKALQLVVDGTDPEIVRNIMEIDLDAMVARHGANRKWFETLGELAPAFGMLGTLVGLIGMLSNLGGDASAIGAGMAAALITTLYGSFFANIFAIPIAKKLTFFSSQEAIVKQILIEGTLSIQAGDNPKIVKEKLISYLSPAARAELSDGGD